MQYADSACIVLFVKRFRRQERAGPIILEVLDYSCNGNADVGIDALFGAFDSDFKGCDSFSEGVLYDSVKIRWCAFANFKIYVDVLSALVLHLISNPLSRFVC